MSYVGAFPVYSHTLNSFDDMWVMAFRIKVVCPDCKAIYINGSQVQVAAQAILSSDVPAPLTIFTGDYEVQAFNHATAWSRSAVSKKCLLFCSICSISAGSCIQLVSAASGNRSKACFIG